MYNSRGSAVAASPIEWDARDRTIDLVHLSRMTLGDRDIEREVLQLFSRQIGLLLGRMADAEPAAVGALAHTLKGSACGVGAWEIAAAAEEVEAAVESERALGSAIAALNAASERAVAAIADLLRTH